MRIILSLLILALMLTPRAQAAGDCTATATTLGDPLTAGVWQQINQARQSAGQSALMWSPTLASAAAWMAHDAVSQGLFPVQPDGSSGYATTDSLGRDVQALDTDCDYRADAGVAESIGRFWTTDPLSVFLLWQGNDPVRMYGIVHGAYAVGGLGRFHDAASGADFWVLDVGTLADAGAPTPTVAPSSTPVPATPTPRPTATPIPTSTPDIFPVERSCVLVSGAWPGPVTLECSS